jgi:hypothetical protein
MLNNPNIIRNGNTIAPDGQFYMGIAAPARC